MSIKEIIFNAYMASYPGITYNKYLADMDINDYKMMWLIAMGMHDTLIIYGRLT